MEDLGRFYLYRHVRLDTNQPFYIGIGSNSLTRKSYQRANTTRKRNPFWHNITKNTDYRVDILFESFDKEIIKEKEIEFIKLYGKRINKTGTLVNISDGGDQIAISEEGRKLRSERMKLNNPNADGRSTRGKKISKELSDYMSSIRKGKRHNLNRFKDVFVYDLFGNYLESFPNCAYVKEKYNVTASCVSACCNKKQKTSKGFIFTYDNKEDFEKYYKTIEKTIKKIKL